MVPIYLKIRGKRTVNDVINRVGLPVDTRIKPYFDKADVSYPPSRISLLAFKEEGILELWALQSNKWLYIKTYPVLGASGNLGPKLQEGDRQVPEGIYQINSLNPNSSYHLSMKIDYPNKYDREKAREDHRINLGGDIFIHGSNASVGCLAMGNESIEELFVLSAKIGYSNVKVIIAPNDFRQNPPAINPQVNIGWLNELYGIIQKELQNYRDRQ